MACVKLLCYSVARLCLTLWCRGVQHARLLWPPLSPRVCSNSCPFSGWCHLNISSSGAVFSFCLQSFLGFPSGSGREPACNAGNLHKSRVQPLGQEDPLEKEMAVLAFSSINFSKTFAIAYEKRFSPLYLNDVLLTYPKREPTGFHLMCSFCLEF